MEENRSPYFLSSVDRALRVLDILSVEDNLSLAELSKISKLDKSSLFKILFTLENRDYVFKSSDARYSLGSKIASYADRAAERRSLSEIALPYMRELRDLCHETVYLGILNTNSRVIVMQMEPGDNPSSIATRIGYELDAHCSAMGKVLLAWQDAAMQQSLISHLSFRSYTAKTITSPHALRQDLNMILVQGWGIDNEERYQGNSGLAVPIFDRESKCVAALSIVAHTDQISLHQEDFLQSLFRTAEIISQKALY